MSYSEELIVLGILAAPIIYPLRLVRAIGDLPKYGAYAFQRNFGPLDLEKDAEMEAKVAAREAKNK